MKVLRAKARTLYDLLPDDVMARILTAGTSRKFKDGQIIQQRGDDRQGVSILTAGQIVAGNAGLDGSFLVSALLRPGETFGEFTVFAGLPHTHTLWAQGETEITFVKAAAFKKLMVDEPLLAQAMVTFTLLRNYELIEFVDAQRRLSLKVRIALLLLTSIDEDAESETVECRQEDLAVMLGVSRVAAGKALKRMEQDGLLRLHYGRVEVPDVARLRAEVAREDQFYPITERPSCG